MLCQASDSYCDYDKEEGVGIPVSFSGLRQDGKKPDLNAGTESGAGRGCSPMLERENFLDFLGKNLVPGKWHSGTQTSRMQPVKVPLTLHPTQPPTPTFIP